MDSPRPKVALLIETSKAFGRGLLGGIARWNRQHRPWSIYVEERGLEDPPPPWLRRWRGNGIISRGADRTAVRLAIRRGIPVVDLRYAGTDFGLPAVFSNQGSIARLAAEHLAERGFRRFGFVGLRGVNWSLHRGQEFERTVAALGGQCARLTLSPAASSLRAWQKQDDELCAWIGAIPRPAGVMCCYDVLGVRVLDACRRLSVNVPEEVSVVGVDNDVVLCELADPPLSSVNQDVERIGYDSAELLDQLMRGESPPPAPLCVEPLNVVVRQSSNVIAIEDADVAAALSFIRLHALDERLNVSRVVEATGLSRRTLERRFERHVGHTPHDEIQRLRLARVKQLLAETDLAQDTIAARSGFSHKAYMCTAFKKQTGQTLGQYRRDAKR